MQGGAIGGIHNEFIFAPRLDNLMMSFNCVEALTRSCSDGSLGDCTMIRCDLLPCAVVAAL